MTTKTFKKENIVYARFLILISIGAALGIGATVTYNYLTRPPAPQVASASPVKPTTFVIDPSKIKTVNDVATVLDALNIRMVVNLQEATPDVERFKKAQGFFRIETR